MPYLRASRRIPEDSAQSNATQGACLRRKPSAQRSFCWRTARAKAAVHRCIVLRPCVLRTAHVQPVAPEQRKRGLASAARAPIGQRLGAAHIGAGRASSSSSQSDHACPCLASPMLPSRGMAAALVAGALVSHQSLASAWLAGRPGCVVCILWRRPAKKELTRPCPLPMSASLSAHPTASAVRVPRTAQSSAALVPPHSCVSIHSHTTPPSA